MSFGNDKGYIVDRGKFCELLDYLREQNDAAHEADAVLNGHGRAFGGTLDFFSAACLSMPNAQAVVDLLDIMFGSGDLVCAWCFELDYGRAWHPEWLTDDGLDVDVSDAGKLYDYLVGKLSRK